MDTAFPLRKTIKAVGGGSGGGSDGRNRGNAGSEEEQRPRWVGGRCGWTLAAHSWAGFPSSFRVILPIGLPSGSLCDRVWAGICGSWYCIDISGSSVIHVLPSLAPNLGLCG